MMHAEVFDLFYLGLDGAGGGKTNTRIFTAGQTWTLRPTLLFDANAGVNGMQQNMQGPDFRTNYGLELWGIPGTNQAGVGGPGSFDLDRYSGMPNVVTGLSQLGNSDTWTPVWRDERSYTVSANLTKVAGRHEVRSGFDFIRLRLNHWQPEVSNPRGILTFGSGVTGTPGYSGLSWNSYAGFMLGELTSFDKSEQFEELSGRENQYGLYVSDRWQANSKLTVNLGLRYEYYPLMTREDRGIEMLDLQTYRVRLGGVGGNPLDLGFKVSKTLFAPRLGVTYRINDKTVFRTGYGKTFDPFPWSRPMRGRFPLTIAHSDAGLNTFTPYGNLSRGIALAPSPDVSGGTVLLPRGVDMTTPDPNNVARGATQSYNVVIERRLPGFDRAHNLQMGFVYELPFARTGTSVAAKMVQGWQLNGIASWLSGKPFSIGGDNGLLQQSGGLQTINVVGDAKPGFGEPGPDERWYDPSVFAQPANAWGNSGRNQFRAPGNWNVDGSLFRNIPFGRYRVELRVESQNVFNHAQWGAPNTSFTDPNFMKIRTLARAPRTVQVGMRFAF